METRNVHVYVFDSMADWEVGHAIGYINQPEYQTHPGRYRVRSVGPSLEPVTTLGGLKILPDMTLADLNPKDSAMLILPGGGSWDRGENREAAERAREFLAAGAPVFETLELYPPPVLDAWHGLFSTGEPKYFYALMQLTAA